MSKLSRTTPKKRQNSKKVRDSAGRMLIRGFIQSFFIVAILLGVGILGYQTTMHLGKTPETGVIVALDNQPTSEPEPITVAIVEDISKNLIYCYNEETNEISKIILEIFHCKNKQMTYLTIPVRTQLTMSDSLYKQLILVHPEMPQMIKLSAITKYLGKDTVFDYGVLMVEELLGIKISYYTVMPQTIYDTIFTEKYIVDPSNDSKTQASKEKTIPVEVFVKEYKEFLTTLQSQEAITSYIEEIYPSLQSNLTLFDKLNYLESYCALSMDNISFDRIRGEDLNSGFVIDQVEAKQQLQQLTEDFAAKAAMLR